MSEIDEVRRKRDAASAAAAARGEDPFGAGIRAAFEHGIPDLERNLPRLRKVLGDIDARSFALGTLVAAFASQGMDVFSLVELPQWEEIPRYLERIKDL